MLPTLAIGTDNVLRASLAEKVGKVVYAASSTYYGNQPVPFAEAGLHSCRGAQLV